MTKWNPALDRLKHDKAAAIERVNQVKREYESAKERTTAAKAIGGAAFTIALEQQRASKRKLDEAFAAQKRAVEAYSKEYEAEQKRWHEKRCTNCGKVRKYRDGMPVPDNICGDCRKYRKGMGTPTPLRRNW